MVAAPGPAIRAGCSEKTDRMTVRIVGVLFIVATATAIVGGLLLLPVEEPNALADLAGDRAQVITGVLLELVLVLAVIGIAALLFPVLRRRDEGLALAYLGVRSVEGVLLLAAAVSAVVTLALSEQSGLAEGAGSPQVGGLLRASREWSYLVGSMVRLGAGALILYSLLYRASWCPAGCRSGVSSALR